MRRLLAASLALATALTAGCIDLAPAYHRPPQSTPATFPTGPAYPAPLIGDAPVVGWQDFFSDPRLKAVIAQALASNRDLREAVANIAAARAQYQVQRAALFPTLTGQASAQYGAEPTSVLSDNAKARGETKIQVYSLSANVSAWQLDLFGKIRNQTKAAQLQYFANREARDAAQITIVSEVASDYLTVGADRALLKIAEDTLKSGTESLNVTQHRFSVGVDDQLDVSQAQTVVQQARFDVARLTTQVAQDRNALDLAVGAPVPDDELPGDVGQPVVLLDRLPAAVRSIVLLQRPDVLEAEDQLKAANANIGAARANFFPDISLTGEGGLTSVALSTLFRGASSAWSFAPTISQTIFDAGANRGNLNLAKAQRDLEVATYEKAIQTAFREVADALAQRGTIDEQLSAQQGLTDASATALKISTARYNQGSDTYLNVLIAQRTLYAAQQTLVAAELAKSANLVTLYAALGGGLSGATAPR